MTDSPPLPWTDLDSRWLPTLHWAPTPHHLDQFHQLYQAILAGNQQLNLTRITDAPDFWEKHLWDSLRGIAPWLSPEFSQRLKQGTPPPVQSVIDIGTGAGFPGLPIAIVLPTTSVTLLDSVRKKMIFLQTLIEEFPLPNAKILTDRAEAVGQQSPYRAGFDLALVRAVGAVTVCAEYALPLVKVGGYAVLYRGQWSEEDEESLQSALGVLGGTIAAIDRFTTPLTDSLRHCIYLKKLKPTDRAYPRDIGIPTHRPL